jgi:hypothetical protein
MLSAPEPEKAGRSGVDGWGCAGRSEASSGPAPMPVGPGEWNSQDPSRSSSWPRDVGSADLCHDSDVGLGCRRDGGGPKLGHSVTWIIELPHHSLLPMRAGPARGGSALPSMTGTGSREHAR